MINPPIHILSYFLSICIIWFITYYTKKEIIHKEKKASIMFFLISGIIYFSKIFLKNKYYILFINYSSELIISFIPFILLTIIELNLIKKENEIEINKIKELYIGKKEIISIFVSKFYDKKLPEINTIISLINEKEKKNEIPEEAAKEILPYFT